MASKTDKRPKVVSQATRLKDRVAQYTARGDWGRALRTLLILQEHAPRDMYIARKIGEMYQRMGKTKKAVEAYKNAARLYAEEGFLYKAISVNKIILSLHPDDQDVLEALATLQSRQPGHRMFDPEHDDSIEPTASSKVVGVYLDRVTKETLLWIPLISELQEEELGRVIDMMVRKKKRLSIMKRVDFEHDGETRFAFTRDLSSGGTYLRAHQIVGEDTELVLSLDLEEDQEPVSIRGNVVRTNPRGDQKGFGVRFHQDGQDQALGQVSDFVLAALEEQAQEQLEKDPQDVDALYELAARLADLEDREKRLKQIEKEVEESRRNVQLQADAIKKEETRLNVLKSSIEQRRREVEQWALELTQKEKALKKTT